MLSTSYLIDSIASDVQWTVYMIPMCCINSKYFRVVQHCYVICRVLTKEQCELVIVCKYRSVILCEIL